MADSFTRGESSHQGMQEPLRSSQFPEIAGTTTQVVLVMDGLKEFTIKPLKWALENISASGGIKITLLGAMPWLNIPLSSKTRQDVWAVGFEELAMAKEQGDQWKSDSKYVKLQAMIDMCKKFGVVPQKEVVMGYPLKLKVVEKLASLHATWVVFDRHQRRDMEFFAEKVPCNLVMMNENGEPVIIRMQPPTSSREFTTGESPATFLTSPL